MPKYLFGRDRGSLYRAAQRLQGKYRAQVLKEIKPNLLDTYKKAGTSFAESGGSVVAAVASIEPMLDKFEKDMYKHYERVTGAGAQRILEAVKRRKSFSVRFYTKQDESDVRRAVRRWIGLYGAQKIVRINDYTREHIKNILKRSLTSNLTIDETAEDIIKSAGRFSLYRAMRIARTETLSAWNGGEVATVKEIAPETKKEWISSGDDRTRDDHLDADGQVVGMSEMFDVFGEELEHPGDPFGSAGNVINCRCVLGYVMPD